MFFENLLSVVGQEPVFDTGFLLAGDIDPNYLRRQLSEWVKSGKLWKLRRSLYALAPPYQKIRPHPFLVANRLMPGSYVSTQAALAYYGLIPEFVAITTNITTKRPGEWKTPLGEFVYHHVQSGMFFGYERRQVDRDQYAFIATAEKALLDLAYLQPGGDEMTYLESLRLQNLERLDVLYLQQMAERVGKPKLLRTSENIAAILDAEMERFEIL
jgi:predicted transcriptional regulator of viral defense system